MFRAEVTKSLRPLSATLILLGELLLMGSSAGASHDQMPRIAVLSQEEAWAVLPATEENSKPSLPKWARMLAGYLPRTTAAYLQLDFAHRASSPLPARLRAAMRWVAANANRCEYAKQ